MQERRLAATPSYGPGGAWVCNFLPHTASIADDLCFVHSMHTGGGGG